MVTKRPIFHKNCLFVLGRHHIHVLSLVDKKTYMQYKNGENKAHEHAIEARRIFENLED